MGILDDLLAGLSSAQGGTHPQLPQVVEALAGGEDGLTIEALVERLQAAGLGGIVGTWISGETNAPIAPDQIRDALGDGAVQAMADRAGLSAETFLSVLAEHLPGLVDHLSQGGRLMPAGAGGTSTTLS